MDGISEAEVTPVQALDVPPARQEPSAQVDGTKEARQAAVQAWNRSEALAHGIQKKRKKKGGLKGKLKFVKKMLKRKHRKRIMNELDAELKDVIDGIRVVGKKEGML